MPNAISTDKKKIIVVDDDEEFLYELADMLVHAGYEVTSLTECASIIDAAERVKPDLIMLDLKIKSVSGFEGASALRFSPSTSCIPIIAMSAFYTMKERDFLVSYCGIKRYLKKPFTLSEAVSAIEDVLNECRGAAQRNDGGSGLL